MTGERFNEPQIETLRQSFGIISDTVEKSYRKKTEENTSDNPFEDAPAFRDMLTEAVRDFNDTCGKILNNDLEAVRMDKWQEIMFLLEILERDNFRSDWQTAKVLRAGLMLLVGMFRNQFPGEKWNPEDVRWTTIGQAGVRGISPMLMAIAEL